MLKNSSIKDIGLAPKGRVKIEWVKNFMPILRRIEMDYLHAQPFAGLEVAMCLHIEAKTAYLAEVIKAGGGKVTVCGSNPLSTQDDVVAALVSGGIAAHAWHRATEEEYSEHIMQTIQNGPNLIIDDGGDLVYLLHQKRPALLNKVIGGCEETTTGVKRLRAMAHDQALKFPMIAVNDAKCKFLFDNRYGTGQSVWEGIMRATNLSVAGKTAVVIGYGWCGKGVALRAKGLGARVIVCEVDPIRANEALMDGFEVMPGVEAMVFADFVVTVTGNANVIDRRHFDKIKNGAVLCNAGHFDVEISKPDLFSVALRHEVVRPNVQRFDLSGGRSVFLLAEGRLVNLASGDGHPIEIMDLSFGLQALSLTYLCENKGLAPGVYPVPEEIDEKIAKMRLQALGIRIDELTTDQKKYLSSWE
ncbi:MAG: adenosylhomocysteinase [Syntrophomonadaceae bacterium]|nr:adenosylhomocysteinase [Syntrophomonadaceae bacterium]